MEQTEVRANGKCRRRYSPEHSLFAAGNALRATSYYHSNNVSDDEEEDEKMDDSAPLFQCRLFNCNVGYQTIAAYEEHYDLVHRNVCLECFRSFLSMRLLDIHISETHDAFFKILSKKKPMYVCLVDGCPETFKHDDKRMKHLIQVHQYPVTFSFHQPRKGIRIANMKTNDQEHHAGTKPIKKKKRNRRKLAKMDVDNVNSGDKTSAMDISMAFTPTESVEKDHDAVVDDDMMAGLEDKMKELCIPKKISFGRKRGSRR